MHRILTTAFVFLLCLGNCTGHEKQSWPDYARTLIKIAEQVPKPIVDTHIHFYQVTRAGGVPWPPQGNRILYRDVLPGDYKQVARPLGIVASGLVEASPLQRDNLWILQSEQVDPQWRRDIERLGAHPNVVIKFSSFCDMFQPAKRQGDGWESPPNLSAYRSHFDVLMNAFGPDRLVWGSNWPVVLLGSTLADQIRLAEEFIKPFGKEVRDKVMYRNALRFYRRRVP